MTTLNEEIKNLYTLPTEFKDSLAADNLTILPSVPWSFRNARPCLQSIYGLNTEHVSVIGGNPMVDVYASKQYFTPVVTLPELTSTHLMASLIAAGVKKLHRAADGTVYLAIQYIESPYVYRRNDKFVNCVMIHPPCLQEDHRDYNVFKYAASGVLARVLRPIADKVGLALGPDKFSYKVTASGLDHTVVQEYDIADQNVTFVSMLLHGTMYPTWATGWAHPTVEALFETLLQNCPIATPETMGLDRATFEYVGDQSWLQDSMFNGLVQYAKTCPEHVKRAILARDAKTIGKALKAALSMAPRFADSIWRAKSKAQGAITVKAAISKVLTSLQGTDFPEELHESLAATMARGDNTTVILGSSLSTVREMALKAAHTTRLL